MNIKKSRKIISLLISLLCLFLLTNGIKAQNTEEDAPIKIDTTLLTMPVTVADKNGRGVAGLKWENFSILEDGKPRNIEYFYNESSPMNVAVLIDTSGSTKEVLEKIQKAARDFVKFFRSSDKGIIVGFDSRARYLSEFTSDRKKLTAAIDRTTIADQAGSDMNAAVLKVVNEHFTSFKGRKAIIVLTDGMVLKNAVSTQQIMDAMRKTDTLFYPIIFKTKFYSDARAKAAANKKKPVPIELLEILAQETAGKFYEKDADQLKDAFQNIVEELKYQYLLGFYPVGDVNAKSAGNIKIEVDRADLTVRQKKRWSFRTTGQ